MMHAPMRSCSRPQRATTVLHSQYSLGVTSERQCCSPHSCWETETTRRTLCRMRLPWCTRTRARSIPNVPLLPGSLQSLGDSRRTEDHASCDARDCCACGEGESLLNESLRQQTMRRSRDWMRQPRDARWKIFHPCSVRVSSLWPFEVSQSRKWRSCTGSVSPRCGSMCSGHVPRFAVCSMERESSGANHDIA